MPPTPSRIDFKSSNRALIAETKLLNATLGTIVHPTVTSSTRLHPQKSSICSSCASGSGNQPRKKLL